MNPDVRRIVAVEAHRRRTGRCPTIVHSLGTGETFEVGPTPHGFVDLASGLDARSTGEGIDLGGEEAIALRLDGDVAFSGRVLGSGERFTGRAGGGASVTVYDPAGRDFFQYAVDACATDA